MDVRKKREDYLAHLKSFLEREKPYLNPELTINELAEGVKIPRQYITEILREELNKNFFTLINDYRINEVKQRLISESYTNFSILQIAMSSGFNSKSSFNSIFKQYTGVTPCGDSMETPMISDNTMAMMFSFMLPPNSELIVKKLMNSFNIINSFDADVLATYNNNIQKMAERTRLGIPVSIASDPRHGTEDNPGQRCIPLHFRNGQVHWDLPLQGILLSYANLVILRGRNILQLVSG
ncbi:MAG: helix-turn-helix transcriptional regulator [Cytophagales bacterium]|nr:helix-turn-helix transcriptional regulator [Cytophagales bacterium]